VHESRTELDLCRAARDGRRIPPCARVASDRRRSLEPASAPDIGYHPIVTVHRLVGIALLVGTRLHRARADRYTLLKRGSDRA
jgi:hypothetical protein